MQLCTTSNTVCSSCSVDASTPSHPSPSTVHSHIHHMSVNLKKGAAGHKPRPTQSTRLLVCTCNSGRGCNCSRLRSAAKLPQYTTQHWHSSRMQCNTPNCPGTVYHYAMPASFSSDKITTLKYSTLAWTLALMQIQPTSNTLNRTPKWSASLMQPTYAYSHNRCVFFVLAHVSLVMLFCEAQ